MTVAAFGIVQPVRVENAIYARNLGFDASLRCACGLRYSMPSASVTLQMPPRINESVAQQQLGQTHFSDEAIGLIHQVSPGLPRSVNNLARQALVAAFANKSAIVDEKATRQAISEADSE